MNTNHVKGPTAHLSGHQLQEPANLLVSVAVLLAAIAGALSSDLARAQDVSKLQEPPAWAQAIDMSQGEVDGKQGIGIWPISSLETHDLVGPQGLTVHLLPAGDPGRTLVFPAGAWILPPPGRYRYWLEGTVAGQTWMSPSMSTVSVAHRPFTGRSRGSMRLVKPAGTVALDPRWTLSESQELRLLHTESHRRHGFLSREMARKVPAGRTHAGALMPEGTVLAALYDQEGEEYIALSKPLRVGRDQVILWNPEPPEATTDVLVVLNRPTSCFKGGPEEADVELALRLADGTLLEPDVEVPSAGRIFGQWYGLDAGQAATLEVRSTSVFLDPLEIALRPARVEHAVADLHPLPSLEVEIDTPAELASQEGLLLQAFNLDGELVRQLQAKGDARDLRLDSLPVDTSAIRLEIPPWSFVEDVSFEDRTDQRVVFRPRVHVVSGTVSSGEERPPAVVSFVVSRDARNGRANEIMAETDDEGRYEVILFRPGDYSVRITQPHRPGLPFRDYVQIPDQLYVELDFQLPHNRVHIRAIDERSGDGVPGARVTANNFFPSESESESVETLVADTPYDAVMQKGETDDEGWLAFPPLRQGRVELVVRADGYKMVSREFDVSANERPREIVVPLLSAGSHTILRLNGPDGQPVAGAELVGLDTHSIRPEWRGTTDREGDCEIPEHLVGSLVLVRAPTAAFLVRPWTPHDASRDATTWQLRPAAPRLEVDIHRPWGDPASEANIAIWQDGKLLSGSVLQWLTGHSSSDRYGKWRASNLPPGPLSMVARVGGDPSALPPAVATNISFPWQTDPVVVTLE
ncbi:MAG: carboxypeptidase-like regulatory domain-containing protein [Acidobacteriota bacterium]